VTPRESSMTPVHGTCPSTRSRIKRRVTTLGRGVVDDAVDAGAVAVAADGHAGARAVIPLQ
jgi:hypothetical protein